MISTAAEAKALVEDLSKVLETRDKAKVKAFQEERAKSWSDDELGAVVAAVAKACADAMNLAPRDWPHLVGRATSLAYLL
ncbi:MAG TPA: hypothetical protein VIU64_05500 [Polyangia bacterium]